MAYTERQKQMRRCRFVKKDKSRCKAFAKIGGEYCALHSVFDAKAPRPKKNERAAAAARLAKRRAQPQRRAVCNCSMLPYPHRFSSTGACPDVPVVVRKAGADDAYESTFARDEVQYESAREAGPVADEYEPSRESSLRADDDERKIERRQELDPLIERQVNAYVDSMERTWRTT